MDKGCYLTIKNLNILNALPNKSDGEIIFLEEEQEYRIFKNGQWEKYKPIVNSGITMYELEKQIVKKQKFLSEKEIEKKKTELTKWRENKYYLLYGKEISYFTLFSLKDFHIEESFSNFGEAVITCLYDLSSEIYSIEKEEDNNAYQIWINYNGEPTILYLFDYTQGVVKYGK